jgi:hypothetical protein
MYKIIVSSDSIADRPDESIYDPDPQVEPDCRFDM